MRLPRGQGDSTCTMCNLIGFNFGGAGAGILLLSLFVLASTIVTANEAEAVKPVTSLTIDLQDGFSDDTVVISVDGQEVLRIPGVNTNYTLGRADSATLQVTERNVSVEILVPTRQLSGSTTLDVSTTVYLGVSIDADKLVFRISDEAFIYY